MPAKISVSILLMALCMGAGQRLSGQAGAPVQKKSEGKQSSPPSPTTNATSATVPPVKGGGKVDSNEFAVPKQTDQASPQLGPAARRDAATHSAFFPSPSAVATKTTENAGDQTVRSGASRAEGASDQITKLGTPRAENAPDQTTQVGASRHHAKAAAITPPADAIQAGPDATKNKKPVAPQHRHE